MGHCRIAARIPAKDPLAVSMFEAVEKLGLALEKRENPKDVIVIESIERVPAKTVARGPVTILSTPELKPEQVDSIDRYVTDEMGRERIPGLAVGIYSRGPRFLKLEKEASIS